MRTRESVRLGHVVLLVADAQLGDQAVERIEDRVQGVAVAGEDHPRGERSGAFPAERVEGLVDDVAGVGLAGPRELHRFGDARRHRFGDRPGQLGLQPGGRAEMVEEIGVRAADLRRHGLERYRLRALG